MPRRSLKAANASFSSCFWVSEEGHEAIVERAKGIQIIGVLFVLRIREKSQKVRVGRVCERIANLRFLEAALDLLRHFEVVENLGRCPKTDDLHRPHLRKAVEELPVLR